MMRRMTEALVLSALVACGGSQKTAGSPTKNPNAPEWVHRGSRVANGSIFGVGMATGIQNTELARTTASNRGRSEISKILEVYSASLMKDYQESTTAGDFKASSEGQVVTQAIKTFSANLLKGTETKEYWLDPDQKAWFALVELNFEKARDLTGVDPGVGDYVGKRGKKVLDDMEGQEPPPSADPPPAADEKPADPPPPPPPPPAAKPTPPPAKPTPAPAKEPETTVGGTPPAWKNGQCDREKFLCGVGSGKDRPAADIGARAELARIFEANIKSVQTSFQSAVSTISSKTGENWQEAQAVSDYSMVSTQKVVTMSEILARWDDGKGTVWALAVIDRRQAGNALRDKIQEKDSIIDAEISRAQGTDDKLARFKSLRRAVAALAEREAANADLRVIETSGQGIPPPHDIGEILSMLEGASDDLSIGIALTGPGASQLQGCLEEALTAKGYKVEANTNEEEDDEGDISGDFDVIIKGQVKAENRGLSGKDTMVKVNLSVKVLNAQKNKVISTITDSKMATRPTVQQAASTAVVQMCKQKMPAIAQGIDKALGK